MLKSLIAVLWVLLAAVPIFLLGSAALQYTSPQLKLAPQSEQQRSESVKRHLEAGLALWHQNQFDAALKNFQFASEMGSKPAQLYQYYVQLWRSDQVASNDFSQTNQWAPKSCLQQIIFVTAELESLEQATEFIQLFKADKRLTQVPICIADKIEFVPQRLSCTQADPNTRINCDIKPLAGILKNKQFTHLVLFTQAGKANVHNGIMYLDRQDTYDVLVHELAHFAGFVDEYPLSPELAERVCSQADAPNLVFKRANQSQIDMRFWQQLQQDTSVALTPARTCDHHTTQAFKPSSKLTFMEYYDVKRIPDFYLLAWQKALRMPQNLTPAFINFAQEFEQQPTNPTSQYWRTRYEQYHRLETVSY